jgi:FMN-dependent NADH-azoreductase
MTAQEERSEEQQQIADYVDNHIEQFASAAAIVLTLPMYNSGVSSMLKAYFDHLALAGKTFKYTENGPVGLVADKPVYVIATRGGICKGTSLDTQTDYVKTFLGFLGIKNVQFVYAEGLNLGEAPQQQALQQAKQELTSLATA